MEWNGVAKIFKQKNGQTNCLMIDFQVKTQVGSRYLETIKPLSLRFNFDANQSIDN